MNILNLLLISFCILISTSLFSCGYRSVEELNYEWKLTFEDNFDSFDKTKWITVYESGGRTNWANKELQWYEDKNVRVENGILKLTANKESVYGKDLHGEKQFEYTSGIICSSSGFAQAYGKWEIRVKFPFRKGFWGAFWLVPKQRPTLPEIDVFEYFGIKQDKILSSHHWGLDYPNGASQKNPAPFYYVDSKETAGDFSDVWMNWTFECFPNKMTWKLNENVVFEATEGIPTAPLYMIANVAVKDWSENNNEVDNTDLPYIMEIDHIKVYKMIPKI